MKALYCGYCHTIASLGPGTAEVSCRCRATVRPDEYGPRCRGRWVYPELGVAIFTEVAQGGNEREHPRTNRGRCYERGSAIGQPKALYVLGIHNTLLTHDEHTTRINHVEVARGARNTLFQKQESLIVRFRPGKTADTAYVTVEDFARGEFPEEPLWFIPEDRRTYRPERAA